MICCTFPAVSCCLHRFCWHCHVLIADLMQRVGLTKHVVHCGITRLLVTAHLPA